MAKLKALHGPKYVEALENMLWRMENGVNRNKGEDRFVDFASEASVFESDETAVLPYDSATTAAIDLSASVTANSALPVIQVLGIEFYQEVNGAMYPLKNGSYNALSVIDVTTA